MKKTILAAATSAAFTIGASSTQESAGPPLDLCFEAAAADDRTARAAMDRLAAQWRDSYTPMIVGIARQLRPAPRPGSAGRLGPQMDGA